MVPAPSNNNRAQDKGSSGRFRRLNALSNEEEKPTTPKPGPEARIARSNPAVDALHAKPFIIRTCQLKLDAESGREISEETGSILSLSLEKTLLSGVQKDAAKLTLAAFHKIVPGMSSYSKIHKFCTESGTIIQDESISVKEHLDLEIQGDSGTIVEEPAKFDEEGEIPEELNERTAVPNPPVKSSAEHSAASVKGIKLYFKSTTFAKKLRAPSELPTAPEINLENKEFASPEAELKPWEKDAWIQEGKFEAADEVLTAATLDE
ncbi:hypothetical protein B9Z65_5412 [Elsinoe australis]|uniref:Uncharacterized protein n=1 Tax=Elsinoe australis TaxID=40998 RepID=A0A2P7ZDZ6_9PEZI|nr:hypothetical protein B9Z65_5412 [Elsinoe australis]